MSRQLRSLLSAATKPLLHKCGCNRDAPIPLLGAGSVEIALAEITVVGNRIKVSTPMAVVAGGSAFVGSFMVVLMWQGERWPAAAVVAALVCLGVAGVAFYQATAKDDAIANRGALVSG